MSASAALPSSMSRGYLSNHGSGNGTSGEAETLRLVYSEVRNARFSSAIGEGRLKSIQDSLREILSEEDPEYEPSPEAVREARYILESLPHDIPTPDLMIEPSGAIACEWYKSPSRVFIMSIIGNQTIEFAALLGDGNEIQGKHYYTDSLPGFIASNLKTFVREV